MVTNWCNAISQLDISDLQFKFTIPGYILDFWTKQDPLWLKLSHILAIFMVGQGWQTSNFYVAFNSGKLNEGNLLKVPFHLVLLVLNSEQILYLVQNMQEIYAICLQSWFFMLHFAKNLITSNMGFYGNGKTSSYICTSCNSCTYYDHAYWIFIPFNLILTEFKDCTTGIFDYTWDNSYCFQTIHSL